MARKTVYLIDGSGYIFRAYYAIRPLSTSTGLPTNAVFGFAKMLLKLVREKEPELLGIAFDSKAKTFRHEIYEDYKANRDEPPEDLSPQFPLIHELVDAMDIPRLAVDGYEADDILGTLTQQAKAAGHDVVIVSGDKDLMQLVNEHVVMYDPMKEKVYDHQGVVEKWGVEPKHIADVLALAGDSSDNIPGVPKVGPKSAAKLITEFGDVEGVIAGLESRGKPKAFERSVLEHIDDARLSKKLTVLDLDSPVEFDPKALAYTPPSSEKMAPFLEKIEARGLMNELGVKVPKRSTPATSAEQGLAQTVAIDASTYRTITKMEDVEALVEAAQSAKKLCFDLETTSLNQHEAEIVGVALAVPGEAPAYIPVDHRYIGAPKQLDRQKVLEALKPVLSSTQVAKVGQNLKYDITVMRRYDIEAQNIAADSMLAAYILDPSRPSFSLDNLSREYLSHENITYAEVAGSGKNQITFDQVPIEKATPYACEDADVALKLCDLLEERVSSAGQGSLYHELELPLVPVLAQMEQHGILVDMEHLRDMSKEFSERLKKIEEDVEKEIGESINLASPKQLGVLFFEKLKYPVVKKTKTGFSTDQAVLEILAKDYELPKLVLEHRMLAKLRSTYVDALPRMMDKRTGRVHTSFNQTGAATGRLSSSDPNLQNIPIRTEDGRRIRAAFIAEDGWELICADYSQIELRVLAHLSNDPAFRKAFGNNEDIHTKTAREVLTGGSEPDAQQRRSAKAINFGIIYGLSEFGLSRQLGIPRKEAHDYISRYFAQYPNIRSFLDRTIDDAKERGFVSTIAGRRRFLPNLNSRNRNVRMGAERIAMNTPIQGSAADLIKMAMLRVHKRLSESSLKARMLLQVHDELVVEAPKEERDEVCDLLRTEMTQVMRLNVPLVVDVGVGANWALAH